MHTHLRMLQKYFMIQRMCSRVIAKNVFNKKSILHMENERPWPKSNVIPSDSSISCPSWTPDGRIFGSSPGVFGSGQNAHSVAK